MFASFGLLGNYHVLCTRAFILIYSIIPATNVTHTVTDTSKYHDLLQRPWKTDFPLPDVSTLFSLVLDGIILLQCFQKKDKNNFMQLNNTDAFN